MAEKLIEQINAVSDEYFELSMELANIAERKGTAWLEIKNQFINIGAEIKQRTNAEVDKLWDATADGRREAFLKIYLKGLEKRRGAYILEYKSGAGTQF